MAEIAYAPEERRVFVSDESGRRDFVIDAATNSVVAPIELDGEAGNTQYDPGSDCVIVAVQTANQLAVIDPATSAIVRRITLDQAVRYPHGVYIDAPRRVAFIAGQESGTLGVLDLRTLQVRQVLPIGGEPDVLAFDSTLGRLYVAAESGVVAVFGSGTAPSCSSAGTGRRRRTRSRSTPPHTASTCRSRMWVVILSSECWCRAIPPKQLREEQMYRTHRFAVTVLGAVTLNTVLGVPERPHAIAPMPLNGQAAPVVTWHFDSLQPGQPPAGFSFGRTGGGRVGHWIVQSAPDAPSPPNVLAQVDSDRTDYRFPVAAAPLPTFTDGVVSVKCKPVSGRVDRACGIVFRYRDENNYYLTRANALEDNVRFYYVKSGRRIQLGNWTGKVRSGVWNELRVDFQGDHVEVYWDARSGSTRTTARSVVPVALVCGPRQTPTRFSMTSPRGRAGRDPQQAGSTS